MSLVAIHPAEQCVEWEFLKGRSPRPDEALSELALDFTAKLAGEAGESGTGLPILDAERIASHVENRLAAFHAWAPLIWPRSTQTLIELRKEWLQLKEGLADLSTMISSASRSTSKGTSLISTRSAPAR